MTPRIPERSAALTSAASEVSSISTAGWDDGSGSTSPASISSTSASNSAELTSAQSRAPANSRDELDRTTLSSPARTTLDRAATTTRITPPLPLPGPLAPPLSGSVCSIPGETRVPVARRGWNGAHAPDLRRNGTAGLRRPPANRQEAAKLAPRPTEEKSPEPRIQRAPYLSPTEQAGP